MRIPRSFTRAQLNDVSTTVHQNAFRLPHYGGTIVKESETPVATQHEPTYWEQFTGWFRGLKFER